MGAGLRWRQLLDPAAGYPMGATPGAGFFAVVRKEEGARQSPPVIAGTHRITIEQAAAPPVLDVYADNPAAIRRHSHVAADLVVYLWGHAAHADLADADVLPWVAEHVQAGRAAKLRDLVGCFVFIVEDRQAGRFTFINDALGVRPWIVGAHRGRLTAGSDVLRLRAADLTGTDINLPAVACWLRYNHSCDNGTVVAGFYDMPAGSAVTYDGTGRLLGSEPYAPLPLSNRFVPREELVEAQHAAMTTAVRTLVRGRRRLVVPLSGGLDSRYVAALAAAHFAGDMEFVHVATRASETKAARAAADLMGRPLRIIDCPPHAIDLFDRPLEFTPNGWLTGFNLTARIADDIPGIPILSGFAGDAVMRTVLIDGGSTSKLFALDRPDGDAGETLTRLDGRYTCTAHRDHVFDHDHRRRSAATAKAVLARQIETFRVSGRPVLLAELLIRNRQYLRNITLQHLAGNEPLCPFTAWSVLALRASHSNYSLDPNAYPRLLDRVLQGLGKILHCDFSNHDDRDPENYLSRHARHSAFAALCADFIFGQSNLRRPTMIRSSLQTVFGNQSHQRTAYFVRKLQITSAIWQKSGLTIRSSGSW